MSDSYPLYSVLIRSYNTREFIGTAIRSVFAQTYPNLEVVISDDASTDGSWDVIQSEVACCPKHISLKVSRNPKSLGPIRNLWKSLQLTTGEVVVIADGDDISLPQRVEKIHQTFLENGPDTVCVWSRYQVIDAEGNTLDEYGDDKFEADLRRVPQTLDDFTPQKLRKAWHTHGAISAYKRETFEHFGGFIKDTILSFNAVLLGKNVCCKEILVQYRTHPKSITFAPEKEDIAEEYHTCIRGDLVGLQTLTQAITNIYLFLQTNPQKEKTLNSIQSAMIRHLKRTLVSYEIKSTFPNLSLRTIFRTIPYISFYRHIVRAILYRLGKHRK